MCMDRDAVARLRQAGDDEGKFTGVQGEGRCGGGSEIAMGTKRRGVTAGHPHHGGDTTPRRHAVSPADRGSNHRADEDGCGSTRGGNEG